LRLPQFHRDCRGVPTARPFLPDRLSRCRRSPRNWEGGCRRGPIGTEVSLLIQTGAQTNDGPYGSRILTETWFCWRRHNFSNPVNAARHVPASSAQRRLRDCDRCIIPIYRRVDARAPRPQRHWRASFRLIEISWRAPMRRHSGGKPRRFVSQSHAGATKQIGAT
jgi:hypothetical protein